MGKHTLADILAITVFLVVFVRGAWLAVDPDSFMHIGPRGRRGRGIFKKLDRSGMRFAGLVIAAFAAWLIYMVIPDLLS